MLDSARPELTRADVIWLLALLVAPAVAFVLHLGLQQPVIFPDENGAILNARHLAGLGPASPWWYLPGYGAVLVPLALLTDDPRALSLGIHGVNALLTLVSGVGLVMIGRRIRPDAGLRAVGVSAGITMLYPAFLYFAGFALADNLLIAVAIWAAVGLDRAVRSNDRALPVMVGVAIGSTAFIHARAWPMIIAGLIVLLAFRRGRPGYLLAPLALVAAAVGSTVAGRALLSTGTSSALAGDGRQGVGSLVGDNLTASAMATLPFTALGQVLYVVAATGGLVVLGAYGLWLLRGVGGARPIVGFVAATIVLGFGVSVLFTNGGSGDFALYGRYLEITMPVVLFLGVLTVLDRRIPRWFLLIVPLVLPAAALLLLLARGSETFDGRLQRLNVSGAAIPIRVAGELDPLSIALFGSIFVAVVAVAATVRRPLALVIVAIAFITAGWLGADNAAAFSVDGGEQRLLLDAADPIIAAGLAPCIALDQTALAGHWHQENYRLHRLDWSFPFFASESDPSPCPGLAVSSRPDFSDALPGWAPVAVEPQQVHWLWASSRVVADHRLEPVTPGRLGAELVGFRSEPELIDVSQTADGVAVEVQITNTARDALIPPSNLPDGHGSVQVGLEWRDPDDPSTRLHEPIRAPLPSVLRSGDTALVVSQLAARQPGLTLERSDRLLRVELVQEGVRWLGDEAATVVAVEVLP